MAIVQLEGAVTINSNTYSDEITSIVINSSRSVTQVPGTFDDADGTQVLGSATHQVTINFNYDEGDADGVWAELYAGFLTDSGELPFTANLKSGSTSATNPLFSGTILVSDLDAGGTVGDLKAQSKTFPAYGIARSTS